jgi:NTP pyrophosphatase (non-canonical NTP hydrolase)
MDYVELRRRILAFRDKREWKPFHDPKNLSEAISIEAGELLEVFLWKTTDGSRELTEVEITRIRDELADIFIFLVYLSEELGINLLEVVAQKIKKNENKYPVSKSKGTSSKYDKL